MLKIKSNPSSDTSITSIQHHAYTPYTTNFNYGDEVRISVQQQDLLVLPCRSYLYIEGTVTRIAEAGNIANPTWTGSHAFFFFDEIRYELNGIEIDRCRNVGITSLMKGLPSFSKGQEDGPLKLSSFGLAGAVNGHFSYCIPLKHVLGFAEDYQKVIMNMKHELILIRSRNDLNCFQGVNDTYRVAVDRIQWRLPHVKVDDYSKLQLLKHIDGNQSIHMMFRSWDLYEYPTLPQTQKNIWTIKTSNNLQKPRYVIFGMQTNRNGVIANNSKNFDHCNMSQVKLYLNSECYPYENTTVDFTASKAGWLYEAFSNFQESYYHDRNADMCEPYVSLTSFYNEAPLVVFDCSRQNEAVKNSMVDIRLEIETRQNIPENTRAFCLIIHDNVVQYSPFTSIVTKNL